MRLVKVCLGQNETFWFLDKIRLTPTSRVSNLFDIDRLSREDFNALNKSIQHRRVKAFDKDGVRLNNLGEHNILGGELPDAILEDTEVEEEDIPQVISVTCENDEESEEAQEIVVSDGDFAEAKVILKNNGNTVRKTIMNFALSAETVGIIQACLELEAENKVRKGVMKAATEKLEEYYEHQDQPLARA